MPESTRFFLGFGERLTERVAPPGGGSSTEAAYTFDEAVQRLEPRVSEMTERLDALSPEACPENQAVGVIALHPQWLAKTSYPQQLLSQYGLRQVGSRPISIEPEKWTRKADLVPVPSTELYVAGNRATFQRWSSDLTEHPIAVTDQIRRVENVRAPDATDRLRGVTGKDSIADGELLLEVVLHASDDARDQYILAGFESFAETLGAAPDFDRRLHAGGLCFLPVVAPESAVVNLTEFTFLRVARPMPRLRRVAPIERSVQSPDLPPAQLPDEDALDSDLRIAVFDGGLDSGSPLSRWATPKDSTPVGKASDDLMAHGHDVTSAALFGHLAPGQTPARPYAVVDHYRVLDEESDDDPFELYDVLRRVGAVLSTRQYEFFNLSIGPFWPIEDDEVHPWTALLDEHLSDGHALATMAVGNNGEAPEGSPEGRIQVPSDCVNAFAVGAADSTHVDWTRAAYSARGPGRSPGRIKPDVMQFGGSLSEPFNVYERHTAPSLAVTCGTSFAAPSVLRLAAGVRAHFGARLSPLAIKALLIHSANPGSHLSADVGRGRVATDVSSIAICPDGMVRVIYQGELTPSQYLRALIPLPVEQMAGMVGIEATFCYASPVDPQDPGSYTRSGLEVTFRPHAGKFAHDQSVVAKTQGFFKRSNFDNEHELRQDAQKWETSLHARKRLRATSLSDPVFDIHYNARSGGSAARNAERIRYALIVTVRSARTPDLYDQVVNAYAGRLEALVPSIDIPIQL